MSAFKLITVATALIFITACQAIPDKAEETSNPAPVLAAAEKEVPVKKEPATSIDSYVLYLLLTGETALQRHKYDVALEAYLEAAKRVKDPRIAEKAAQIAEYLSNLPKSEKAVLLSLDKDDKNITAKQIVLSAVIANKNQAALLKFLNAILKNNPAAFEETLLDLEKALKSEQDIKFIYQTLDLLAKQHPQQAMIFLIQSTLAVRQNNIELAMQKVRQALVLQPKWEKAQKFEAELLLYSGKVAFRKKQFPQALALFDQIKYKEVVFDAATSAVFVLMEQKKFSDAATRLETLYVKEQDPKQKLQLLVMQAELQNMQKNHPQALEVLTQALKDNPEDRDILYARALTAEKMADFELMEADLKKILVQDPDDVGALNALGYALTDHTTRYDEAEKYLHQAIKLQPEEAMIVDSYGWLQFKKGNLAEALKYLQTAHKKMPENEITAHLAETLWVLGKKPEAELLIKEALKKTPSDEFLLEVQQRVLKLPPSDEQK